MTLDCMPADRVPCRGANGIRPGYRILLIGPQWHGSNAAGLARAFRRLGHIVQTVDETTYEPAGTSFHAKVIRKLLQPLFVRELNNKIIQLANVFQPELFVVFKGTYLSPGALEAVRKMGVYTTLVYPDVSFYCHGPYIPQCLPIYDWVFTTKSFGVADFRDKTGKTNCELLHHGYDPEIHRPVYVNATALRSLGNDASFIGTWSPKKEHYLAVLAESLPQVRLRIWGSQWEKASELALKPAIEGTDILGDIYPLAIGCSKINICILSEKRRGSSHGDEVTSRTFHIPASGGFMLHERTAEVSRFYREGEEVGCFGSPQELAEKVEYYLQHEDERTRIRLAGHRRCVAENSQDRRAQNIIERYAERVSALCKSA